MTALADAGYHTVCVGGVGFFNQRSPLGRVLPGLFAESHWDPSFGVTDPDSTRGTSSTGIERVSDARRRRPLFLFLNVVGRCTSRTATTCPARREDGRASHAAALDVRRPAHAAACSRFATARARPCLVIVCSDHGTAYGEDGHTGHRVAHAVVWTVPYAEFVLSPGGPPA